MLRRLALAALLALAPSLAAAQFATIGPTPATSDNGDRLATTAWVNSFAATALPLANGTIWIGNVSNLAAAVTVSGDCTVTNAGVMTCLKTNGTSFTAMATAAAGQLPSIATNTAATAGKVGEYITSTVLLGSAVSITTGVARDITSVSLTAGDWQCTGVVYVSFVGSATALDSWTSATSATFPTRPNNGGINEMGTLGAISGTAGLSAGSQQFLLSGTTSVFLSVFTNFSSTATGYGFIGCRRMR